MVPLQLMSDHERLLREAGQRRGCINTDNAYFGCDTHDSAWWPDFGCCYETALLLIDRLARQGHHPCRPAYDKDHTP